jgi:hypothetical protein
MIKNDLLLRALSNEKVERPPVWMMRQAGRYLPEFRALRDKYDFFTRCETPELAAEITVQPIRIVKPDAAILFSDLTGFSKLSASLSAYESVTILNDLVSACRTIGVINPPGIETATPTSASPRPRTSPASASPATPDSSAATSTPCSPSTAAPGPSVRP